MAIGVETVVLQKFNPSAGVEIAVAIPVFAADEVRVTYGIAEIEATPVTDYTIELDTPGNFSTFKITPTAELIIKIAALMAANAEEEDYIFVSRWLDYLSDSSEGYSKFTRYLSLQHDRTVARLQQLQEQVDRTLRVGTFQQVNILPRIVPDSALVGNTEGDGFTFVAINSQIDKDEIQAMFDYLVSLIGSLASPTVTRYPVGAGNNSVTLPVSNPTFAFVFNDGVFLTKDKDYTISGNTLTAVGDFTGDNIDDHLTVLTMSSFAFPVAEYARKRYISMSDYANPNDALSSVAAEQAAHNDAYGKELVYDNPYLGKRYYRGLSRGEGRITTSRKTRIIVNPGAIIDRSAYGKTGAQSRYFQTYATFDTATAALTGPIEKGDETITFVSEAAAAAYAKWGFGLLACDDLLVGSLTDCRSQWVQVVERTGAVVKLFAPVLDDFVTNPRILRATELCEVQYQDMVIIGAGKNDNNTISGDRGIWIGHGINCGVDGGRIYGAQMQGLAFDSVMNGYAKDVEVINEPSALAGAQYPIAIINNCENFKVSGCGLVNGREGVALTDTGMPGPLLLATGGGIPRNISIVYNSIKNMHRSGVTTHWAGRGLQISYNFMQFCEQMVDIRIRGATEVSHNTFEDAGTHDGNLNAALQISNSAADITFSYNTIKRAGRVVFLGSDEVHVATPGNYIFEGNEGEDISVAFLQIRDTTGSTAERGSVESLRNTMKFDGASSVIGVELEGNWKATIIGDRYLNAGAGSSPVKLHATDNGGGTNGPRELVMRDVRWGASFGVPILSHLGSGVPDIQNSGPIGAVVFPEYTLNVAGNPGIVAYDTIIVAANTGTTDNFDGMVALSAGAIRRALAKSGHTITVRHAVANIVTKSAGNVTLTAMTLVCDGVTWFEV